MERVDNIGKDFRTAIVLPLVLNALCVQNLPLATDAKDVCVGLIANHLQVDTRLAMGPRAKFHGTVLSVKREVRDVDAA